MKLILTEGVLENEDSGIENELNWSFKETVGDEF
jgi:hypothetical protein